MYFLKKNPAIQFTQAAAATIVESAKQSLADSSEGLTFDPVPHKYFFHGREMRSVSSIVEEYAPFDTVAKAEKASKNPKHEHFGKSVDEIIAIWEENRDRAADAGTKIHAFGEACCLWMLGREDEIEEEFRDRITPDGLRADSPKEIAVALWWNDMDWSRYAIVAKETRVVNPILGYAGTFDLLLFDLVDGVFRIKDYKSNEDLFKWFGDYLQPPLNMIKANDVGKYTLQQTLYGIQINNIGLPLGSADLVWLKQEEYDEVSIDLRYARVIAYAIQSKMPKL